MEVLPPACKVGVRIGLTGGSAHPALIEVHAKTVARDAEGPSYTTVAVSSTGVTRRVLTVGTLTSDYVMAEHGTGTNGVALTKTYALNERGKAITVEIPVFSKDVEVVDIVLLD